jgi:hypothetical protein
MHEIVVGFVCFTRARSLSWQWDSSRWAAGPSEDSSITPVRSATRRPSSRRGNGPANLNAAAAEPEPHAAWPECDCPSEAFHSKYHPAPGVNG